MKEDIRNRLIATGAAAVGFAAAEDIDPACAAQFDAWLAAGYHAGMQYLERHAALRRHPRHVLDDARSVISLAYSYPVVDRPGKPMIASYALGDDYHDVLRRHLSVAVHDLRAQFGGNWRICIDSAPLPERYWALRAGIGRRGRNGSVIVDGTGCTCFLAEILTSLSIEPDRPSTGTCTGCGRCTQACPTGALKPDGTLDARRCISYLTIEHRGEFDDTQKALLSQAPPVIFGCDLCQRACPHSPKISPLPELGPRPEILALDADSIAAMTPETYARILKNSPLKRAKLPALLRNFNIF